MLNACVPFTVPCAACDVNGNKTPANEYTYLGGLRFKYLLTSLRFLWFSFVKKFGAYLKLGHECHLFLLRLIINKQHSLQKKPRNN